jgi:predicted phosphodiesterase
LKRAIGLRRDFHFDRDLHLEKQIWGNCTTDGSDCKTKWAAQGNAGQFAAVLHGHTHVPNFVTKKGVLYFNPGSCGPRRFELPVTIGILTIESHGHLKPQIVHLRVAP